MIKTKKNLGLVLLLAILILALIVINGIYFGKNYNYYSFFRYVLYKLPEYEKAIISEIECSGISPEIKELALNSIWMEKTDNGCVMCDAEGCSCTVKAAWKTENISIDIVYGEGHGYFLKYNNETFSCSEPITSAII